MVVTFKKFLHKKGGLSGRYKKMQVLEKFVIETKKLPENFETLKPAEQKTL